MTIHFFTFSDRTQPSSRQRTYLTAEELEKRGFSVIIHMPTVLSLARTPWPKKGKLIFDLLRTLPSIKRGDVIYLQRAVYSKYFFIIIVIYLVIFRRKMIFDFDDPVYVHTPFKTKVFTQMADAVIVCTHGQAEWAKRYNDNVHIIHISVDFPAYQKFTKKYGQEHSPLIVGWVGTGPEHIHNLEILAPVFRKLLTKTIVPFKFVIIGALKNKKVYKLFQDIPGLEVEFVDSLDWTDPESAPREIQKFDIGVLSHRSDGEWNQGKTSLKILEYMACGVATTASSFGEMPYIIRDGVNGFLASTGEEWVEKLKKLLSNSDLRVRLGKTGQKMVQENYSYDAIIPRLIKLINSLSESTIR